MTERMQTKSVPMSEAMIERIRVRAQAERRTWSQVVRMLIEAGELFYPSPVRVGPSEVSEEG